MQSTSALALPLGHSTNLTPHLVPVACADVHDAGLSDEAQLVRRMLERDGKAWRHFDAVYGPVVRQWIRKLLVPFTRVVGASDADEIHARFCLSLVERDFRRLRAFDAAQGGLKGWVRTLAGRAVYDYLRVLRRERCTVPLHETELASEAPSLVARIVARQQATVFLQSCASLSPRDQQFAGLYFEQGLSCEDVAKVMGISLATVYSKKHKILQRLGRLTAESAGASR